MSRITESSLLKIEKELKVIRSKMVPDYLFLDAKEFRRLKEDCLKDIAEAESKGWKLTRHGSITFVRELIREYEKWEQIGFYRGSLMHFWHAVLSKSSGLARILHEEELQSIEDAKERFRKYGRGKTTLLYFEMYDLPWLLEIQEKNLGLPDFVQVELEDGRLVGMTPEEWIKLLQEAHLRNSREKA